MKVISIEPIWAETIKTDEYYYPVYRRAGPEQWQNLIEESWETIYSSTLHETEAAYQAFKKEQADIKTSKANSGNSA